MNTIVNTDGINYNQRDLEDHNTVAAVIRDVDGKVLVMKHHKFGFWTIPVGKAEAGQSDSDALVAEVFEETDIEVIQFQEIARKDFTYIRNGIAVNVVGILYDIEEYEGIPLNKEPEKHSNLQFMSIEELREKKDVSHLLELYLSTRN